MSRTLLRIIHELGDVPLMQPTLKQAMDMEKERLPSSPVKKKGLRDRLTLPGNLHGRWKNLPRWKKALGIGGVSAGVIGGLAYGYHRKKKKEESKPKSKSKK